MPDKTRLFVHRFGQGGPALGEKGLEQKQGLRAGLQINSEGPSQIAAVRITGLLVTADLEQGADDVKAIADILDRSASP